DFHSRDLVGAGRSALPKYSRMTGTLFFRKSLSIIPENHEHNLARNNPADRSWVVYEGGAIFGTIPQSATDTTSSESRNR
ncbi:hypothetical protein, partial [Nostoc sp.]|uniref:hypothetical protein n=1 Tax=Nostoc sp. TaxID=1180 RepID=UPI002FFC39A2